MSAGCKIRSFCILRPEGSPALWPEDVLPGHVVHCHRDAEHGCQGDEFRADVAVDGHAVVGAPVSHDGVYIAEGTLAGQARCKPGGGPGRIGPLVQHPVHFIGQQDGRPLGKLQHKADTLDDVETEHGHGHFTAGAEVRGESAAAEILIIGPAPVGGGEAGVNVLLRHIPERLHPAAGGSGVIKSGCAGIDQMNKAVHRGAGRRPAGHALHGFRTPVGPHVVETGRGLRDQGTEQHAETVERVVFGRKRRRLFRPVPVERRGHDGFGEITIRKPVGPLALALETGGDSIPTERLLVPAELVKLRISIENIADDDRHLRDEFPVLVGRNHLALCDDLRQRQTGVAVIALPAVLPYPGERLPVLLLVINAERHAAQNLSHIDPLRADAEIFLHHLRVTVCAHDAHRDAADVDV